MTTDTTGRRAAPRRHGSRPLSWLVAAVPLLVSYGFLDLVGSAWMACTEGSVATYQNLEMWFWTFTLPASAYGLAGLLRWRFGRGVLAARLARCLLASGAAGLVYVYLSARYFTLTQFDCVDGLPVWWPSWLPAR